MAFLFSAPVTIDIQLEDADKRTKVTINHEKGKTEELYRFTGQWEWVLLFIFILFTDEVF